MIPEHLLEAVRRMAKDKPPIPFDERIFRDAISYHEAASRCMEVRTRDARQVMLTGPSPVLGAFAAELYLKTLYVIAWKRPPKRGHGLDDLFNKLPDDIKQRITTKYKSRYRPGNLVKDLKGFAKTFVVWRYAYELEGEHLLDHTAIAHFASSLLEIIIEERPEFRPAVYDQLLDRNQGMPLLLTVQQKQKPSGDAA